MESKQDKFFAWLSKEVPSFRMNDYSRVIGDLESFARKNRIINGSLFDIEDPVITGKIVNAVSADKIFRFNHKKEIKRINKLAHYFHKYTKARSTTCHKVQEKMQSNIQSATVESYDLNNKSFPHQLDTVFTVDFINDTDYGFTRPISISYFEDLTYESSWHDVYIKTCKTLLKDYPDDFKFLRDNNGEDSDVYGLIYSEEAFSSLMAPVKIGDGYYIETKYNTLDIIRNIKHLLTYCRIDYENLIITYERITENKADVLSSALSGQNIVNEEQSVEITKDPILDYLEQCGLEYIDYRQKSGCLWIIGGRDITEKVEILHKNGIRMHFKARGGRATNGKDAWWTKDETTKPIKWLDNGIKRNVKNTYKKATPQNNTIQEERLAFISWLESKSISKSFACTVAILLSNVSDIAIEQGVITNDLYTIRDSSEVALVLARLENNDVFQEYRRYNKNVSLSTKKYVAFRSEQKNGKTTISISKVDSTTESLEDKNRKDFCDYLTKKNYSLSTVRSISSAVNRVSKYTNEHGYLAQSLFLINDYNQLQSLWNRLQNDNDFSEYDRSQNTRFTVAINHFLTYTRDHDKSIIQSSLIPNKPLASPRSAVHQGRIEFEQWLKKSNCSTGSIKSYVESVEIIGKYLLEAGLEDRNIFSIRGVARLEKIQENLLNDSDHVAMFGASNTRLDCNALKKYIDFRKSDSINDVDDINMGRYTSILRDNFENGFRINSMIDRNRFKHFYLDVYGEEITKTDVEILEALKRIGSVQDDRIFVRENSTKDDLIDDIQAEIAEVFADGISCVSSPL